MTNDKKKEIQFICGEVFKELFQKALERVESKYADVTKERAINDVHSQNEMAKRNYPENSYLSFNLATGNFIVPYDSKSLLKLTFIKDDNKKELKLDTKKDTKLDIAKVMKLCKEYDFVEIVCETFTEFDLFDEDKVEEGIVEKTKNNWTQTFEGFARCSDVVAVYQNVAKIEKVAEA